MGEVLTPKVVSAGGRSWKGLRGFPTSAPLAVARTTFSDEPHCVEGYCAVFRCKENDDEDICSPTTTVGLQRPLKLKYTP